MTIGTGSVAFSAIQTEFGGANPISLSEYYRGGSRVPSGTANGGYGLIATSGAISVGTFRGTSASFSFNQTISGNTPNYNIRSAAISAGWNGTQVLSATITINSGFYVYSTSTGSYALDTGTPFPSGSTLSLTNNGLITGCGGVGGAGGSCTGSGTGTKTNGAAGSAGGPALRAQYAITITNNGTIGGGGGGGGGGAASSHSLDGGKTYYFGAGGGGGGGRGGSSVSGGAAGSASGGSAGNTTNQTAGGTGTLTAVGSAGSRGVISGAVGAGNGAAGGALGTAGATGGTPDQGYVNGGQSSPGGGGAAGAATNGSATYITWSATGTRLGTIG